MFSTALLAASSRGSRCARAAPATPARSPAPSAPRPAPARRLVRCAGARPFAPAPTRSIFRSTLGSPAQGRAAHTPRARRRSLAAWHDVPAGLASPRVPRFGKSLSELGGLQSFPVAEEDLAQLLHGFRLDPQRRGDRGGGLACAQQVACVQRLDLTARQ